MSLIARFMGPTWGPSVADRTQVGPCWPRELCYLELKKKNLFDKMHFCTKYNNSQSRLLIRQETLSKVHMHRLHKGHYLCTACIRATIWGMTHGSVFCICLNKFSANEKRHSISNIFCHLLKTCLFTEGKKQEHLVILLNPVQQDFTILCLFVSSLHDLQETLPSNSIISVNSNSLLISPCLAATSSITERQGPLLLRKYY